MGDIEKWGICPSRGRKEKERGRRVRIRRIRKGKRGEGKVRGTRKGLG